jgi:hypothetical protein
VQGGLGEHNIPHQEEAGWKTDAPGHDNRGDMGLKDKNTQVQVLFMKDKILADKIADDVHQRIGPPAGRIPEGLQRHDPAKGRIEEINERNDPFFGHLSNRLKTSKILINRHFLTLNIELISSRYTNFAANSPKWILSTRSRQQ